jgi:hypothetical protein
MSGFQYVCNYSVSGPTTKTAVSSSNGRAIQHVQATNVAPRSKKLDFKRQFYSHNRTLKLAATTVLLNV